MGPEIHDVTLRTSMCLAYWMVDDKVAGPDTSVGHLEDQPMTNVLVPNTLTNSPRCYLFKLDCLVSMSFLAQHGILGFANGKKNTHKE